MNLKLTAARLAAAFPQALTNTDLVARTHEALKPFGFTKDKTLLTTSLCCDEVCQELDLALGKIYDQHYFAMGGLAGFPLGGVTSFGAMAHHIPDGGACLLVYGPHIGIDSHGAVGTVERRGRARGGACCGSGAAALQYIQNKYLLTDDKENNNNNNNVIGIDRPPPTTALDVSQYYVETSLEPYASRLVHAVNPTVELSHCLFEAQDALLNQIVEHGVSALEGEDNKVALLGGIQINTPNPHQDYFLPLRLEVRNHKNQVLAELLEVMRDSDMLSP